jgi:hypothetical protein
LCNPCVRAGPAGNWPPDVESVNPAVITCQVKPPENTPLCSSELEQMANLEGVSVSQTGPNPPPPSTVEEKLHPPSPLNVIVSEALKAADISTVGNGYSENNDPVNTITVFVGLRPRDEWAVIPTNFSKRQKTPQDITDDDF